VAKVAAAKIDAAVAMMACLVIDSSLHGWARIDLDAAGSVIPCSSTHGEGRPMTVGTQTKVRGRG
jgi:hypothetical protein